MDIRKIIKNHISKLPFLAIFVTFLMLIFNLNERLVSILVLLYTGCIGYVLFTIVWNTREKSDNFYMVALGIGFLFISSLSILNLLTVIGEVKIVSSEIFNLLTYFIDATSFFFFAVSLGRKKRINYFVLFINYLVTVVSGIYILHVIVYENNLIEYFISVFMAALIFLYCISVVIFLNRRTIHDNNLLALIIKAVIFKVICFTSYIVSQFGIGSNAIFIYYVFYSLSYYFVYLAIVKYTIRNPVNILFNRLKESEKRYKSIFDNSYLGIVEINAEGYFVNMNSSFLKTLGYSKKELKKMSVMDVSYDDDVAKTLEEYNKIKMGEFDSLNYTKRYIKKNGDIIFVDLFITAMKDLSGDVKSFVVLVNDVTEEHRINSQLNKLATAINQVQNAIVVTDTDGNIEFVNPQFTVQTGYTFEEVAGKNLRILKTDYHDSAFYKDLWGTIISGRQWKGEFYNRKKNGEFYWESSSITPVMDKNGVITNFIAIKEDITEIKKIADDLKKSQEEWKVTFDAIPDLITIVDDKQRVVKCNKTLYDLLGVEKSNIEGLVCRVNDDDKTKLNICDFIITTNDGNYSNKEVYIESLDKYYYITTSPMYNNDGSSKGAVHVARDITELKKIEFGLSEANATKNRFFSIISHDLRNPFQGIIGLTGVILENTTMTKEEILNYMKLVNDSAKNTYELLENLLEWSRTQSGGVNFRASVINMNFIISESVFLYKNYAANKSVTLNVSDQKGVFIFADENMIRSVLRNIINNAIKFTPSGGIVSVVMEVVGDEVVIKIKDFGTGMSESDMENLFKIDRHFSKKGTSGEHGTGLGLILCYEFIKKNNGTIQVESKVGIGTLFTVKFPLYKDS